jgi:hypothetical protein
MAVQPGGFFLDELEDLRSDKRVVSSLFSQHQLAINSCIYGVGIALE